MKRAKNPASLSLAGGSKKSKTAPAGTKLA
jgi:hypothetical protein